MEWQKLWTALRRKPKWMGLSLEAKGLWTEGKLWVGDEESEGRIPAQVVYFYAGKRAGKLAEQLVDSGLWERESDGAFLMHDYADHQPDASALREKARQRKAKSRSHADVTRDIPVTSQASRRLKTQNKTKTQSVVSSDTTPPKSPRGDLLRLVEVWNENCGDLPRVRGVPERGELRQAIDRAGVYFAWDFDAVAASVQRVAGDTHYRENRYGLVAWARHLDRWDDPAGTKAMSSTDRAWADSADEFLRMRGSEQPALTEGAS